jgi:6-phosphofructokinase 1
MKKVGIINGGGDTQGMNAVIASAVLTGLNHGIEFYGFMKGWDGVLDNNYIKLGREQVRGISHLGGTILQTVNKGRFTAKVGTGQTNRIPEEFIDQAKENLDKLGIDSVIVIGGDGTLSGALQMEERGINLIGVPKTIDNDLQATDQTFGFSTAVSIAVDALDRIHTTAVSHDRVIFVETMGRHVGWIALHAGLGGGADVILIPEIPYNVEGLVKHLRYRRTIGRNYSVVVVSEGAMPEAGSESAQKAGDLSEVKLSGASEGVMKLIEQIAPGEFEMRNTVLGHIQRGGSPNAEDRILAKAYGAKAVEALMAQKYGQMVAMKDGKFTTVSIREAVEHLKSVTKEDEIYQTAKNIGVYFGE